MLLLGWMATGCSDNEAIIIENETTQEGAVTLVLKGYESASEGFSICIRFTFKTKLSMAIPIGS